MQGECLHIAVVDDEEPVRKALGRLLESVGMIVETFTGGGDFLASLGTHCPDCLVLDLHMPGMSGFELMDRLQRSLPVIVITGQDSEEAEMRAIEAGAGIYLRKPVNGHQLIEAIRSVITRTAIPDR
jgi:FixJ family two-component response regulator